MDTVVRSLATREGWLVQAPSLGLALVTAEAFYKFHSFTLECLAFLATWYLLGRGLSWVVGRRAATPAGS